MAPAYSAVTKKFKLVVQKISVYCGPFFWDYSHGEPHSHGATILQIPFLELHGYPWLPVANVAPWLNRQGISHIKIDPGAIELHN